MKHLNSRKNTMRVGILGNGFMGRMRAHAYRTVEHIFQDLSIKPELYAVSGIDAKSLDDFSDSFGIPYHTENWQEIVQDESIEIVSICLPEYLHADAAILALQAGKHILCEKALALDSNTALKMVQAAQASDKISMCGFNYRFLPAVQLARNLIRGGVLGQIYTMRANYLQESGHDPDRPVEEVVYAYGKHPLGSAKGLGSHVIDTCRFVLGEMTLKQSLFKTFIPSRKTKNGETYRIETDDFATMTFEFETGAIGILSTSKVTTGRKNWFQFEVNGSKGSLVYCVEKLNNLSLYLDKGMGSDLQGFMDISVTENAHPLMRPWWPPVHNLGWEHSHINEIHHFLSCIEQNHAVGPLGATFEDGYKAVDLIEKAEKAGQLA